VIFSAKDKNAS